MKFTKILSTVFLLLMLAFVFCACGNEPPEPPESNNPNQNQDPTVKYTITWFDESGNEIKKTEVASGSVPENTYSVTDTAEWDYTFAGWSLTANGEVLTAIPKATQNASYYAVVNKAKCKYTVNFVTNGGSSVANQSVDYGTTATQPEAPTYEGHIFLGWYTSDTLTTAVDWSAPITANTTYYAAWKESVDIVALLRSLLEGYSMNPYSYLPETMLPTYSANLISGSEVITDYSDFVSVSDITSHGFGEQWNMIIENVEQSAVFFNVLSVVETLSTASVTAFNNYIDQNPQSTASYTFSEGIYSVSINHDDGILTYVIDYTADIPAFGSQTIQIALTMNVSSGERIVRVQIGDANALKYTFTESSYEFAIKYLGTRRAYFSLQKDLNDNVSGHIYEFLGVESAQIKSSADFYITDNYVTAVGNKADGMIGFDGYISETYSKTTGRLIGYEVNETLSLVNFDTLWFDLDTFSGINSIKYVEDGKNSCFYLNNSSEKWSPMNVSTINRSRRFDIEFRTQYFYSYDSANEKYEKISVQVPMLFIQEGNYDTMPADIKTQNDITVSHTVSATHLAKILSDYDTYIPIFITNKDSMTSDTLVAFIGDKITH